jgi:protein TonB
MNSRQSDGWDWPRVWLGAALLTLAVFLVLPLTQMASSRAQRLRLLSAIQTIAWPTETPPPETPPPPPPPAEEPPEPPPPPAAEPAPSLNLAISLELASGAGGLWGLGPVLSLEPGPTGTTGDTFGVEELEKPPEVLFAVAPVYPASLRRAGVEGRVVLLVVVDENGQVQEARVERSTRPEFEAPALEAIRKWRFRPGQKDGKPVRTFLRQPIRFSLAS